MKISLNSLKKYVNINIPTDELLKLIGSRLVEIEGTEDLSAKYQGIKIVKVAECEKLEGTHLSLCQIQVSSDESDLMQVVCGAPNVRKGMLAAWIMPGSIVPETFGGENFRLSVRKLRGYDSHGMLAAADELGFLGASHDGIIEIDPRTACPGDDFAEVFGMNDIILDIENKSLTHRPDTFGLVGFAREIAGILGQKFNEPAYLSSELKELSPLKITIEDSALCPRYSCAVFEVKDDFLASGKYFTRNDVFLYKSGMRPISPIVDLTNILMLETGQPLHAFDYDKFVSVGGKSTPEILVRLAKDGETLQLLDGKTIDLNPNDILITSAGTPVALAGAMGGKNTEIDASTRRIILESATFSLYNLRKTQMSHGIFSEAITRFTKGQPASQTLPVLSEAVSRLSVSPESVSDSFPGKTAKNVVKFTTQEVNSLLGTNYKSSEIASTLENVGFELKNEDGDFTLTAPSWRTDIHIREDIIEEVGRLLGYDNIPLDFPVRPFVPAVSDPIFTLKSRVRNILSSYLRAHEVLTYSFVSKNLLEKCREDIKDAYKITNSISPELECFRTSIVPSILDKVRDNIKSGFTGFTLYEINQISKKSLGLDSENVPVMETHLASVSLGDFYSEKHLLLSLFRFLGISGVSVEPFASGPAYFEPAHSAVLKKDDAVLAHFGEIRTSILSGFKLSAPISAFELDLASILPLIDTSAPHFEDSKFPSVSRDITLSVADSISFDKLEKSIISALSDSSLIFSVAPVSIFKKSETDLKKNVSFHLTFESPAKTLSSSDISAIMEKITVSVASLGAQII